VNNVPIEVVLFDLGGVIVPFRQDGFFASFIRGEEAGRAWVNCPIVKSYETGQCSRAEFAERVIDFFALDISAEIFLDAFLDWPQDIFQNADKIVADIDPSIRVGCLSNTSEIHWQHQKAAAKLRKTFEIHLLSFELGLSKPEPEIYLAAADTVNCPPQAILFFDDSQKNVDGAIAAGYDAHRVDGPEPARQILHEKGLLSG